MSSADAHHGGDDPKSSRTASPSFGGTSCSSTTGPPLQSPSRIAFGSCNSQNLTQALWPVVESRNPTAFVWGGDAIYGDIFQGMNYSGFPPRPMYSKADPARLHAFYSKQLRNPGYSRLINGRNLTVFGTLDDHDMGMNNGDARYDYARESGLAFLDFTGEPVGSPIRRRAERGWGVYGVKVFDFSRELGRRLLTDEEACIDPDAECDAGPRLGLDGGGPRPKTVAVFVLDCRTNKTPWGMGPNGRRRPDPHGDFLGPEQWRWFESALSNSRAEVNVIVNGLQVHPEPRTGDANLAEGWGQFPTARQRLYDMILNDKYLEAPILVSGDVHMAQLMRKDCFPLRNDVDRDDGATDGVESSVDVDAARSLVEITTSGMTHSWGTCASPQVKHHTKWYRFYSRFASRTVMSFLHFASPFPDLIVAPPRDSDGDRDRRIGHDSGEGRKDHTFYENGGAEGAKRGKQYSLELNFGELEFDWDQRTVTARILGKDNGQLSSSYSSTGADTVATTPPPLLAAKWSFDQLSGRAKMPGGERARMDVGRARMQQNNYGNSIAYRQQRPGLNGEWACIDVGGIADPVHDALGYAAGWMVFSILLVGPFLVPAIFLLRCCRACSRSVYALRVKSVVVRHSGKDKEV